MDKKIIIMVPESCKVDETLEIIEGIHMISKSKCEIFRYTDTDDMVSKLKILIDTYFPE